MVTVLGRSGYDFMVVGWFIYKICFLGGFFHRGFFLEGGLQSSEDEGYDFMF